MVLCALLFVMYALCDHLSVCEGALLACYGCYGDELPLVLHAYNKTQTSRTTQHNITYITHTTQSKDSAMQHKTTQCTLCKQL